MNFHLYEDENARSKSSIATARLADNSAAVKWAKTWVETHGDHDIYTLEREDGKFVALLVLTAGGQWYYILNKGLMFTD